MNGRATQIEINEEVTGVVKRRVYDDEKHVHSVTFSCYRRRNYLEPDVAKRIVIGQFGRVREAGLCEHDHTVTQHLHGVRRGTAMNRPV